MGELAGKEGATGREVNCLRDLDKGVEEPRKLPESEVLGECVLFVTRKLCQR